MNYNEGVVWLRLRSEIVAWAIDEICWSLKLSRQTWQASRQELVLLIFQDVPGAFWSRLAGARAAGWHHEGTTCLENQKCMDSQNHLPDG